MLIKMLDCTDWSCRILFISAFCIILFLNIACLAMLCIFVAACLIVNMIELFNKFLLRLALELKEKLQNWCQH